MVPSWCSPGALLGSWGRLVRVCLMEIFSEGEVSDVVGVHPRSLFDALAFLIY